MNRSYNPDIAVVVGGIPEVVVLKEIAYWCERNRAEGKNEHDGRFWTYNPTRVWQEKFPEIKNIGAVLGKLTNEGWIDSGVFNRTPFDRTKSYTVTDKSISLFLEMDSKDNEIPFGELFKPIPDNKPNNENIIERIKKEQAEVIGHLYSLYPAKTYRGDRGVMSTGKCEKDKTRIAHLLKTHTPQQIENSIKQYIEETGGQFLKNFSTFLNNMPDYEGGMPLDTSTEDEYAHYQ